MKKIRFLINYGRHEAGHVIGTTDSSADQLVNAGIAKYEDRAARALKYQATAEIQAECVAPTLEEMEASPKGAVLPVYETEYPEAEQRETKTVKAKKKKK